MLSGGGVVGGEAGLEGGSGRERDRTECLQRTQPILPHGPQEPGPCSSNCQGQRAGRPHFTDEKTGARKAEIIGSLGD